MYWRVSILAASVLVCGYAAVIPAGTEIPVRLTAPLSSATGRANDPISAVVIEPVMVKGQIVIAQHTIVTGRIAGITPAKTENDAIILTPEFTGIRDDAGHSSVLSAKLIAVDDAREKVNDQGQIVGIVAKDALSSRLDQGIGKVAQQYSQFADLLGTAKGILLRKADPNIEYQRGVEMTIRLTKALTWNGTAAGPQIGAIEPADALAALVNAEPFRTVTDRTNIPSDVTNLMFVGSRENLAQTFQEAGWSPASALSGESKYETFRAMAEMRGYQEAPVSILLLEGRPPDLVFQKQNNTFAARHHLRIWHMPQRFNGLEVWVCAATHDTGISFSEEKRTFIHKIDSDIDHERAKVVSDLLFTGRLKALALVDRENVPRSTFNGTGDRIETNGRMAVLEF